MVKLIVKQLRCREKGKVEDCICGKWEGAWGEERTWRKCFL